jgi:hypothetical protein
MKAHPALPFLVLAFGLQHSASLAADRSWTGNVSPFWMDAGNWSGGVAPVTGDNLLFTQGNLNSRSNYNNFPSGTTFGSITISEGSIVQYILAGNPITLTNGISASSQISSGAPVIDCNILFNGSQTISASRSLVLNGNLVLTNTSYPYACFLYPAGSGSIFLNGTITAIIGPGQTEIYKTNSGTLLLGSGSNYQPYSVYVGGGVCRLDDASGKCFVTCCDYPGSETLQGSGVADQIWLNDVNARCQGGTLSPGDAIPGIMRCNVASLALGTLLVQLNGTLPGTGYSQLIVSSNYDLGTPCGVNTDSRGQLAVQLGYAAQLGDSFLIINGHGSGAFDNLPFQSVLDLTNGYALGVSYTNGVRLTTLLTPSSPFVLWKGGATAGTLTCIYTNTAWSCPYNWAGNTAPTAGSRLQFSEFQYRDLVAQLCSGTDPTPRPQTNDLAPGTSLASLLYTGTNYTIYGNPLTLTEGITNQVDHGTNFCFLNLVTAGTLVFDGLPGGTFLVGGSINGSGTVRKEGAGILDYKGTTMNSFVGSVVVENGIFRADGSFTDGSFTLNGGMLTGTGTVSSVTMNGGTLLPGASPGILRIQGNLTMTTGSVFQVKLDGPVPGSGYDQLEVNGTVSLGGAILNVQPGFTITPGTAFLILVNDTSNPLVGTFAGLPEGAAFASGGQYFTISYKAGPRANDVLLTRINPPGNFSSITRQSLGTVQLQGTGGSNVAYTIQANTNLSTTNWLNIGIATAGNSGIFLFNDTNVLTFPQRFFRVLTP